MVGIMDIGFLATAIVVSEFVLEGERRIEVLGFACAGLNIIMYGSPLSVMVSSYSIVVALFSLSRLLRTETFCCFFIFLIINLF